jgi:Arc/MetJ-type ribon-helix-helix transcriptional regulator
VFDNSPHPNPQSRGSDSAAPRPGPEDERIALRCNRKELQLLDSFVASGEFSSRSELMRAALRAFLHERALSGAMVPGATDTIEVRVRLRSDELATYSAYGELVENGSPVPSVLAALVRRGALETKVSELVAQARASVRQSAVAREQVQELQRTGDELSRRGIVGR